MITWLAYTGVSPYCVGTYSISSVTVVNAFCTLINIWKEIQARTMNHPGPKARAPGLPTQDMAWRRDYRS
jgi:hypothetical protein